MLPAKGRPQYTSGMKRSDGSEAATIPHMVADCVGQRRCCGGSSRRRGRLTGTGGDGRSQGGHVVQDALNLADPVGTKAASRDAQSVVLDAGVHAIGPIERDAVKEPGGLGLDE